METFDAFFLDTNVFIHFLKIDQIDWAQIAQNSAVELVVCMQVIHELDRLKADPRLKDRAREAIKTIEEYGMRATPVRQNVNLSILNREVRREEFVDHLSPDHGDDVLLHYVSTYSKEAATRRIGLISDDLGIRVRALAVGVTAIALPDKYRREDPTDEQTRKVRELSRQLTELRDRLPKFQLCLVGGSVSNEKDQPCELRLKQRTSTIDKAALMREIITRFPLRHGPRKNEFNLGLIHDLLREGPDFATFNSEMNNFYKHYEGYLDCCTIYQEHAHRVFEFSIELKNCGRGPADNVQVKIFFPKTIQVVESADVREPKIPPMPSPPSAPQLKMKSNWLGPRVPDFSSLYHANLRNNFDPESVESDIDVNAETGEHQLTCSIRRTIHQRSYTLANIRGLFAPDFSYKAFELNYRISTADHPEVTEGRLAVRTNIVQDHTSIVQLPALEQDE